jgi:hypothetical protein
VDSETVVDSKTVDPSGDKNQKPAPVTVPLDAGAYDFSAARDGLKGGKDAATEMLALHTLGAICDNGGEALREVIETGTFSGPALKQLGEALWSKEALVEGVKGVADSINPIFGFFVGFAMCQFGLGCPAEEPDLYSLILEKVTEMLGETVMKLKTETMQHTIGDVLEDLEWAKPIIQGQVNPGVHASYYLMTQHSMAEKKTMVFNKACFNMFGSQRFFCESMMVHDEELNEMGKENGYEAKYKQAVKDGIRNENNVKWIPNAAQKKGGPEGKTIGGHDMYPYWYKNWMNSDVDPDDDMIEEEKERDTKNDFAMGYMVHQIDGKDASGDNDLENEDAEECAKWNTQPGNLNVMFAFANTHLALLTSLIAEMPGVKAHIAHRIVDLTHQYVEMLSKAQNYERAKRLADIKEYVYEKDGTKVSFTKDGDYTFAAPATDKQKTKFKGNPSLKMCMMNVNRHVKNVEDKKFYSINACIHPKYGWISYGDYSKLISSEMEALHAKERAGLYKYINEAWKILPEARQNELCPPSPK